MSKMARVYPTYFRGRKFCLAVEIAENKENICPNTDSCLGASIPYIQEGYCKNNNSDECGYSPIGGQN